MLDIYCSGFIAQLIENIDYFISVELALKWALLEAGHSSITRVTLFIEAVDTAVASCYSSQNMNIPLEGYYKGKTSSKHKEERLNCPKSASRYPKAFTFPPFKS